MRTGLFVKRGRSLFLIKIYYKMDSVEYLQYKYPAKIPFFDFNTY